MDFRNTFGAVYQRVAANSVLLCCLLLLVAVCALALKPASKPSYQRFIPSGDRNTFALDTKTGQLCLTVPPTVEDVAKAAHADGVPFCKDLYEESK